MKFKEFISPTKLKLKCFLVIFLIVIVLSFLIKIPFDDSLFLEAGGKEPTPLIKAGFFIFVLSAIMVRWPDINPGLRFNMILSLLAPIVILITIYGKGLI